jgi:excisionase family DNA binding protein
VGELLTQQEVADYLKVSLRTIQYWIRDGHLPAKRIGPRAVRIDSEDLVQFARPVETIRSRKPLITRPKN